MWLFGWRKRKRRLQALAAEIERRERLRAEALVEVERRGMMGGKPPHIAVRRPVGRHRPETTIGDPFTLPASYEPPTITYDPSPSSIPDSAPSTIDPGGGSSGGGGADGTY